jgi:hypothetical protein
MQERDHKFMVKNLIIKRNEIKDESFSLILKGIAKQEGIELISYHHNELGDKSMDQIEEIFANKGLETLDICYP